MVDNSNASSASYLQASGSIGSSITSVTGAVLQAQAQQDQARYAAAQFRQNQKIAGVQANLAKSIGDREASQSAKQSDANIAEQRVAGAAGGTDVNSGSNAMLQSDTQYQSQLNQITIRNNAWREAWGYQMQAAGAGAQAQMALNAGNNEANNTLLTGGMNAISSGLKGAYAYQNARGTTDPATTTSFTDSNYTMPTFGSSSSSSYNLGY